jgi:hypothetical protein
VLSGIERKKKTKKKKSKEEDMVENAPVETPSEGRPEPAMDVEVGKIASQNLTLLDG